MKCASWEDCLESATAVHVTPNQGKINSLRDTAKGRIMFLAKSPVDEHTCSYIFEGYYSSLLEMLHALILEKGYKVDNHLCIGYYLRDVLKRDDLFRLFDDCRFKRNSLVYYGKRLDLQDGKKSIETCNLIMKEIKKL